MKLTNKILQFLKKKKYIYIPIVLILIIGGIFLFRNGKNGEGTITINHSDFVNQISVSGKVVAAGDVDLAFKNSGAVRNIYFSVGQEVKAGSLIARIDAKDAEKAVYEAEISLASAKLDLEKNKLENSETNLNANFLKACDDGFTVVSDSLIDFLPIIDDLEDLFSEDSLSYNVAQREGNTTAGYRDNAEKLYYQAKNSFDENKKVFRLMSRNSSSTEIENIINKTYETAKLFSDSVKSMKNFVDYLAKDTEQTANFAPFQEILSQYADIINEHFADLLAAQIRIKDFKDAFPTTNIDLQNLLLVVKQQENTLRDARNELEDYFIRAPFDGIITKVDAKIGEIAISNTPLVSMISAGVFQVESYVPEVNIAQIKLGEEASITLDAYGEGELFFAKIVSIDPAETIRDGVSTYKTKLQFLESDDRIKSGMTANALITTFNKPNVVVVPRGVVFDKNGKKFVQVKVGKKIIDTEVVLGSSSSLGQVEVISGLADGDVVILNPK